MSRVTFRQAEERDIEYWQNVSAEDKLTEVERLRKSYWSWKLGSYPQSMTKDYITQLGYPPLRIDILNDLAEINFIEAEKSKKVIMQGDISINFIGLHELIRAKEAANRKQDIADVEKLKKINKL